MSDKTGIMVHAISAPDELSKNMPSKKNSISKGKAKARDVLAEKMNTKDIGSGRANAGPRGGRKSKTGSSAVVTVPKPPSRPTLQSLYLEQYVHRDHLHAAALDAQATANIDLIRQKRQEVEYYKGDVRKLRHQNPAAVFGTGYAAYEKGLNEGGKPRIIYPCQRRRPGGRRTRELRIPRKEMATQAEQLEELIPVRLDIDWDKIKLRDTFTWNLHDRVISPELFAEQLVEDFKLPPEVSDHLVQFVAHTLSEQIQDFYPQVFIEEEALDPHLPYHAYKNDEMRVLIKINITIDQHTLVDQFEWEINNPLNSPEEFAQQMTRDLSLSGEFTTAIAHCIREQCQLFTKSLYITGHPFDGRPVEDADLRLAFLPSPLPSVFRQVQHAKDFTPYLWKLNEAELDRAETSISREQRRQKRSVNRRGGPALPDLKDRQRTVRTLVVSSVLPGAAESIDDSRLFKRAEGGPPRPGRRGAATGAKVGIGDDSDSSSSSDSDPESPVMSNIVMTGGTSRTRGIRGAASAAQAAMRALGRSTTPEAMLRDHAHETRTSARRGAPSREDNQAGGADGTTFIVKLKISSQKLRQFERNQRSKARAEGSSHLGRSPSQVSTPLRGSPGRGSMAPPPQTPGVAVTPGLSRGSPHANGTASGQLGAVDAGPPAPGQTAVSSSSRYGLVELSIFDQCVDKGRHLLSASKVEA